MDDGHAALVGELPQVFGPAADADLDGPLRVQHARQHRLPERPAVMELRALEGTARIAMGIDVHQPHRRLRAHRLEDRQRDRMVAADAQRRHSRRHQLGVEGLDVLVALLQAEPAAEGNVADVGDLELGQRRQAVDVMVGPDALDCAHRSRSEPRAGPVGDAEVHRHAHQRRVEAREVALLHRIGAQGRVEQGGDALVGLGPAVGAGKHLLDDLAEFGIVRLARRGGRVSRAQVVQLLAVHLRALLALHLDRVSGEQSIAAEFPANPRRHIFTRCYP